MKLTYEQFIKILAEEIKSNEMMTKVRVNALVAEMQSVLESGEGYTFAGLGTFTQKSGKIQFEPDERLAAEINFNYAGMPVIDADVTPPAESLKSKKKPGKKSDVVLVDSNVADEEDPFGLSELSGSTVEEAPASETVSEDSPVEEAPVATESSEDNKHKDSKEPLVIFPDSSMIEIDEEEFDVVGFDAPELPDPILDSEPDAERPQELDPFDEALSEPNADQKTTDETKFESFDESESVFEEEPESETLAVESELTPEPAPMAEEPESETLAVESELTPEPASIPVPDPKALLADLKKSKEKVTSKKSGSSKLMQTILLAASVLLVITLGYWYIFSRPATVPPTSSVTRTIPATTPPSDASSSTSGAVVSDGSGASNGGTSASASTESSLSTTTLTAPTTAVGNESAAMGSESGQEQVVVSIPLNDNPQDSMLSSTPDWGPQEVVRPAVSAAGAMFGLEGEARVIAGRVFGIIVHSLPTPESANLACNEIAAQDLRCVVVVAEGRGPGGLDSYRVAIGQFPTMTDAENARRFLPQPYASNNFVARIN
jgi:nucleoid DNA-binding protein